jgi:hypothetical protein
MHKSHQNIVPSEFESLYKPALNIKRIITSKNKEIEGPDLVQGFVLLHYCTFILSSIGKINNKIDEKILPVRQLIENILEGEQFTLLPDQISQLSSFIDKLGKEFNLNHKAVVYVSLYEAYLDSCIYKNFNTHLGMYTLYNLDYIAPETVEDLKRLHGIHSKHLQNV